MIGRRAAAVTLVVLASALSYARQERSEAQYQIGGVVVDHLTNRPVPRALVTITPVVGSGQLSFITAEDGRFGFTGVPKGKYRLMAQYRGQFPHAFQETDQYSTAIVAGPGLDATNVVFPLSTPASIAGSVVDGDGDPVALVPVVCFRQVVQEGERVTVQTGNFQTDSSGKFYFGGLAAGTYFVAVQSGAVQADAESAYPVTYYGDTSDADSASRIELAEGEKSQIQIAVRSVPAVHVPIDAPGGQQARFMPELFVKGLGGALLAANARFAQVDGTRWELTGIAAGHYLARVHLQGEGNTTRSAMGEVEVADHAPLSINTQQGGLSISGNIRFEGERRPDKFSIRFVDSNHVGHVAPVTTADGSFNVAASDLVPGLYNVVLSEREYYIQSIAVRGARTNGDAVELGPDSQAKLSIVAAPSSKLCTLDAFATKNGSAVAGAMVLLVPEDPRRTSFYRRDQTDSDGSFTMAAIAPGKYTLVAIDDSGRELAYKERGVIQPYLAAGQSVVFPRNSRDMLKVEVQPRRR